MWVPLQPHFASSFASASSHLLLLQRYDVCVCMCVCVRAQLSTFPLNPSTPQPTACAYTTCDHHRVLQIGLDFSRARRRPYGRVPLDYGAVYPPPPRVRHAALRPAATSPAATSSSISREDGAATQPRRCERVIPAKVLLKLSGADPRRFRIKRGSRFVTPACSPLQPSTCACVVFVSRVCVCACLYACEYVCLCLGWGYAQAGCSGRRAHCRC